MNPTLTASPTDSCWDHLKLHRPEPLCPLEQGAQENVKSLPDFAKAFGLATGWQLVYQEIPASRRRRSKPGANDLPIRGELAIDDMVERFPGQQILSRHWCEELVLSLNEILAELDTEKAISWKLASELENCGHSHAKTAPQMEPAPEVIPASGPLALTTTFSTDDCLPPIEQERLPAEDTIQPTSPETAANHVSPACDINLLEIEPRPALGRLDLDQVSVQTLCTPQPHLASCWQMGKQDDLHFTLLSANARQPEFSAALLVGTTIFRCLAAKGEPPTEILTELHRILQQTFLGDVQLEGFACHLVPLTGELHLDGYQPNGQLHHVRQWCAANHLGNIFPGSRC